MTLNTFFAAPERSSHEDLRLAYNLLDTEKAFLDAFGALSGIAAILDNNRQIIYANNNFLSLLGLTSIEPILGKRPGEAVGCVHQFDNMNGCGTSEACSVCGAVNSVIRCQQTGQKTMIETRITSLVNGKMHSWDLRVTTAPLRIKTHLFYAFLLQDISDEKKRQTLERIFFHDLLNSAGGILGLVQLLKGEVVPGEAKEILEMTAEASNDLVEEIMIHRQLRSAENGDLIPDLQQVNSVEVFKSAIRKIKNHEAARGKTIVFDECSSDIDLKTDRIILQRILVNMLKNALEASPEGGSVKAEIHSAGSNVTFFIKNDSFMPRDVQLQVFQRSFSTKGIGRGTGTYSMKLLGENYLNGKVGFTSSESEGTVFFIDLKNVGAS